MAPAALDELARRRDIREGPGQQPLIGRGLAPTGSRMTPGLPPSRPRRARPAFSGHQVGTGKWLLSLEPRNWFQGDWAAAVEVHGAARVMTALA